MSFSWACDVTRAIALARVRGGIARPERVVLALRKICVCDDCSARRAIALVVAPPRTHVAIGEALGLSHATVRTIERRAIAKLQRILAGKEASW